MELQIMKLLKLQILPKKKTKQKTHTRFGFVGHKRYVFSYNDFRSLGLRFSLHCLLLQILLFNPLGFDPGIKERLINTYF